MKERIEGTINQALAPSHLQVIDESHMHNVPAGAQSHFKLVVVSEQFAGQTLVARHRQVNRLLLDLFGQGLHALALHTFTPEEWQQRAEQFPASPQCLGGGKAS